MSWDQITDQILGKVREGARLGLKAAGTELVNFARSYTDEMRPPVARVATPSTGRDRKGRFVKPRQTADGADRQAHPGHWADRTGDLMRAYDSDVVDVDGNPTLRVFNTAPYAAALEKHQDFWVVEGLVAGGHVEAIVPGRVAEGIQAQFSGTARPSSNEGGDV